MASRKLYRIRKEHIKQVDYISNYYIEMAFIEGYVFVRNVKGEVFMINTTVTKKSFTITLLENVEIVGE